MPEVYLSSSNVNLSLVSAVDVVLQKHNIVYILFAMTKRIYIGIRVEQYQYIFYLKVKHVAFSFTNFVPFYGAFLLLTFVLPPIQ